jgi:replicative DNA helicase
MIQLQVLNYILETKDSSLILMNNLTDDFFSDYRKEFKFIKTHLELYNNICDKATFLSSFPTFEIINVSESPNYLIKGLYDDFNTRKLAETFNKVRTYLMNNDVDAAMQLYQRTQEQLSTGVSLRSVDIIQDTTRFNEYVERCRDFNKYYISTGFKELDKVVGGFDREEELATIVARTNYGKSWILLKCAVAAAQQGLRVGIYSGEMSERKVGYRVDTLLGHMNNGGMTHGNIAIQNEYKKYIDELPNMNLGPMKVLTPKMIDGPADVNALRMFIEKEQLDILFVDQLSLLEDQRRGKTAVDKMSNISKDLKNLQVMKRIPIISVCQQNRTSTESGGVDTTQIAQSDRIGQDSTMIIFLEKKDEVMKLTLVKSRDSENGKVLTYVTDLNKGNFTYVPDENDANNGEVEDIDYSTRYVGSTDGEEVF